MIEFEIPLLPLAKAAGVGCRDRIMRAAQFEI